MQYRAARAAPLNEFQMNSTFSTDCLSAAAGLNGKTVFVSPTKHLMMPPPHEHLTSSNPGILRVLSGISQSPRGETLIILSKLFLQSSTGELDDERTNQQT